MTTLAFTSRAALGPIVVLCAAIGTVSLSAAPSFRGEVFPILRDNCLACHSAQTKMGELVMEDYRGLMRGGTRGPSIVPGDPAASLMVRMLTGEEQPAMPLNGKLPQSNIDTLVAWIESGAEGGAVEASRTPEVPHVEPKIPVRAPVGSLAWSPDSRLLALGRMSEVELVEARSGEQVRRIDGPSDLVRALAFSPDGHLLVAAGGHPLEFGEWILADSATGVVRARGRGHADSIYAVDFSPDGASFGTASYDRLAKLWSVSSGQELATLKDHVDAVFALDFGPLEGQLATAGADRSIKLWSIASAKPTATVSEPTDGVLALTFDPSGRRLAAGGRDKTLRTWKLGPDGPQLLEAMTGHDGAILSLAFSPDGAALATASADLSVKLWDAATLQEKKVLGDQSDWPGVVAFSPDGSRLAVGRHDGSLTIYDAASWSALVTR